MKKTILIAALAVLAVWLVATRHTFFRLDLTAEGRYSLSEPARNQLRAIHEPLTLRIYLTGDLDANMARLKNEVLDLVGEMNVVAGSRIETVEIDPNAPADEQARYAGYQALEARGIRGMNITRRRRGGSVDQSIVFPWAELCSTRDTMAICLLAANGPSGESGEQSINSAVEDVEFQLIDAVRVLNREGVKKIAFLEGHGELDEQSTYDISDALSRYFQIDRGVIGPDPDVLSPYAAIVIAKPLEPFSEADKYVIDQYIMRGGRVLWMLDGVQMSDSMLSTAGMTPLIARELNLNDQLFRYGVRITPTVVEDMQCAYMPVNTAGPGEKPRFQPIPWTFSPLLQLSPVHPVTKNVGDVLASYPAGIELVGDTADIRREVLMVTSNASHVSWAPGEIDIMQAIKVEPQQYFVNSFIPIGVALSGRFTSIYAHRMLPAGIRSGYKTVEQSPDTRMIVVSDGDVARNNIQSTPDGLMYLPVGYDRVTQQMHGNRDFVVNSLLYLTDDEGIMSLRRRQLGLRLLNRVSAEQSYALYATLNTVLPLVLFALLGLLFILLNRKRYAK